MGLYAHAAATCHPGGSQGAGLVGAGAKARCTPEICLTGLFSRLNPRNAGVFYIRMSLAKKV